MHTAWILNPWRPVLGLGRQTAPPLSYNGFGAPGAFHLPLSLFKQPPTIVFWWFRARPMDIERVAASFWFRAPNCPPSCILDSGPQGPSTFPSPCLSNLPPLSSGGFAHTPWISSAWRPVFSFGRQTAPPSRISFYGLQLHSKHFPYLSHTHSTYHMCNFIDTMRSGQDRAGQAQIRPSSPYSRSTASDCVVSISPTSLTPMALTKGEILQIQRVVGEIFIFCGCRSVLGKSQ